MAGPSCHHLRVLILCVTLLISPVISNCYAQYILEEVVPNGGHPIRSGNHKPCYPEKERKHLFVFGDSLFDPGNNQYLNGSNYLPANFPPYGLTFFHEATGRVSDGRVVPDFIAIHANLSLPVAVLKPGAVFTDGASFASAGSGALEDHTGVMNLKIQVENFKNKVAKSMVQVLGEEKAKKLLMKSVYVFSMGGNDYFKFNTNNKNPSVSEQVELTGRVMQSLAHAMEEIYALGGRKFAFQNVGPLGCLPIIKQRNFESEPSNGNNWCIERFLRHARIHNNLLKIVFKELENLLPGFKYSVFDYYTALKDRILNAEAYGFKGGKIGCCGAGEFIGQNCGGGSSGVEYTLCDDPNDYVFFDGGHTSDRANGQLADLMWDGPKDITAPLNVKQLFEM